MCSACWNVKYLLRCVAQRGDGWDLLAGTLARCGVVGSTSMAWRGKQNNAHSGLQGIGAVSARYIGLGVKPRIHDHCPRCDEASSSAFRPRFLNFDVFLSSHRTTLDLHVANLSLFGLCRLMLNQQQHPSSRWSTGSGKRKRLGRSQTYRQSRNFQEAIRCEPLR